MINYDTSTDEHLVKDLGSLNGVSSDVDLILGCLFLVKVINAVLSNSAIYKVPFEIGLYLIVVSKLIAII